MSRQHPRSVYVRRWLLLLAAGILAAWVVLQVLPDGTGDGRPASTTTVTALPSVSPSPKASATPKPRPTAPAEGTTTSVVLATGTRKCASRDVAMVPAIRSPQFVRKLVFVDVAITTSSKKSCVFTPTNLDPIAVISDDDDTVWDSSVCDKAVVSRPVQLVPGWATTVRVPWIPRESGDNCAPDEDWLDPASYTLRLGTLGGEPGRADFKLVEPPPPPPSPTPAPSTSAQPKPAPVKPTVPPPSPKPG